MKRGKKEMNRKFISPTTGIIGRGKMKINLSNRLLYTFITLGILILLSVGVYAYGTSSPSTFGHSVGELELNILNVVSSGNTQTELRSTNGGTPYIDFSNDATSDYDARIILAGDDGLSIDASVSATGGFTSPNIGGTGIASYHPGGIYVAKTQTAWIYPPIIYLGDPNPGTYDQTTVRVSGSITAGSFIYGSDRSLKTNIQPLTNSLEKVKQLQGVSFNWKSTGNESIGLIAQDVEKIFPELVSGEEGNKAVEYGNIVAVLIEAIKEQDKKIDSLQKQIDELKEKCN